ncbi:MAG: thioesterase family protein [Halobacteriales archaeon]
MRDEHDFETEIEVRYRDVDAMGHVNNAVYATYLEQARTAYIREVAGLSTGDIESVLASLSIDFREPIALDETVTVGLRVADLGESSITMTYGVRRADGTVAATAETVQVTYDRETDSPRPVPADWREAIEAARVE